MPKSRDNMYLICGLNEKILEMLRNLGKEYIKSGLEVKYIKTEYLVVGDGQKC